MSATASPRTSWGVLQSARRELGWAVGALYLLHRALQSISRGRVRIVPYGFYAQPLGRPDRVAVRDDPNTVVRTIAPDDPMAAALPRPTAVIARRFSEGSMCHVAQVKGEFAGMIWTSRARHVEDEVRCSYELLSSKDAWDFDVYVDPAYRLGRTLARLWQQVDSRLTSDGARWSFSRISMFNQASIKAHERLGASRIGSVLFFVIGETQLAVGTKPPRFHVSSASDPGPILPLKPP